MSIAGKILELVMKKAICKKLECNGMRWVTTNSLVLTNPSNFLLKQADRPVRRSRCQHLDSSGSFDTVLHKILINQQGMCGLSTAEQTQHWYSGGCEQDFTLHRQEPIEQRCTSLSLSPTPVCWWLGLWTRRKMIKFAECPKLEGSARTSKTGLEFL